MLKQVTIVEKIIAVVVELGRHTWLKPKRPKKHPGSTPGDGTNDKEEENDTEQSDI